MLVDLTDYGWPVAFQCRLLLCSNSSSSLQKVHNSVDVGALYCTVSVKVPRFPGHMGKVITLSFYYGKATKSVIKAYG